VKKQVASSEFDDYYEISGGVDIALARIDADNDRQIKHEDLVKQWVSLATIMTPHDIAQWLEFSVGLPEEAAQRFERGGVTGLQLPMLLDPVKGTRLLSQLNVKLSKEQKPKLWAAIKLRMLGVGNLPPAPPLALNAHTPRCGVVPLSWNAVTMTYPDTHLYRLFRRKSQDGHAMPEDTWMLVYAGRATTFSDRQITLGALYDYKLEAWNLIGVSPSTELHDVTPLANGCGESPLAYMFRVGEQLIGTLYQALAVVFFAFLVFRHATKPTIVAPPIPSLPAVASQAASIVGHRSSVDLQQDELASLQSSSLRNPDTSDSGAEDGPLSGHCRKCRRPVRRSTRHICGGCQHAFCMQCTVYHPHLEVRSALGNVVVSPCGIESRCRCGDCYVGPPLPPIMPKSDSGSGGSSPPLPRLRHKMRPKLLSSAVVGS